MTSEPNTPAHVCINCGKPTAIDIRRDELFGSGKEALIIENIPMLKCLNCGLVYLEPAVSEMIDEICSHPECHASFETKQVAKIA
ncbi:MAG: YgiT-type zinc finger protein [Acidobacteria bacterium]|nr:YgiT-type zinc finger protein [Acidobacteriota bacterium]